MKTVTRLLLLALVMVFAPVAEAHEAEKYSWSIRNFGANNEEQPCSEDLSWEQYRRTYIGVPANKEGSGFHGVLFEAMYRTQLARPGHCFGMSLLSLLINEKGGHQGFCAPVSQFSGDASTSGQCVYTTSDGNTDTANAGPDDERLREAMVDLHGHQLNLSVVRHIGEMTVLGQDSCDGRVAYQQVLNHGPSLVSITDILSGGGHTMVAYDVEDDPAAGLLKIYVYDPNRAWPTAKDFYEAGENVIEVETNEEGRWKYKEKGWGGGWVATAVCNGGHLFVTPLSLAGPKDRSAAALGLDATGLLQQIVVFSGEGAALEQVTDADGRRAFVPGTNQIDGNPTTGLRKIVPYFLSDAGDEPGDTTIYVVIGEDGGPLDYEVRSGTSGYELLAGNARSYVKVRAHRGAGTDRVRLRGVGTSQPTVVLRGATEPVSFDVELSQVIEIGKRTRTFRLSSLAVPRDVPVELRVVRNESAIEIVSPQETMKFDLEVSRFDRGVVSRIDSPGIAIEAGKSLELRPRDWHNLQAEQINTRVHKVSPERALGIAKPLGRR